MATTADRISEAMKLRDMRQADLVEKTGISKGALSSYISGRYVPKQNNVYLIAKALDVSEAWLMGGLNLPHLHVAILATSKRFSSKPESSLPLKKI